MTARSKKWWIVHVGAGVAAMALVIFGAQQCSQKKSEREAADDAKMKLARFDNVVERVDSLFNANGCLVADNRAKADTIRVLKDSVNVLNGELTDTKAKLKKCESGKRCVRKTKPQPKPQPKPQSKPQSKPQPKPQPQTVEKPVHITVKIEKSQNNGQVVVAPAQSVQSVDVSLQGGSVNNGAIVVGNNNTVTVNNTVNNNVVVADTAARAQQTAECAYGYVKVKRVYRVR